MQSKLRHQLIRLKLIMATLICGLCFSAQLAHAALSDYNVVWPSRSGNSAGSMPIGNGDIGMNVWAQTNGDLMLLLSKTDAWSENARLLKLGRLRIKMSPNPFANGQAFVQTLNLENGEILISAGSGDNEVRFKVWADANHPVIHVEADGDVDRDWTAQIEIWRNKTRGFSGAENHSTYGNRYGPNAPLIRPDTVVEGSTNEVVWYHRNVASAYPEALSVQDLYQDSGEEAPPDPLLNRTFGGMLYADDGFENTNGLTLQSITSRSDASFSLVLQTEVTPTVDDWLTSLIAKRELVDNTPLAEHYTAHTAWWNAFWQRHWMNVTATGQGIKLGDNAYKVTQGYILQRFMQAASGRGGSPIKFNGSIFTVDATSGYDADYRLWGGAYWWQNTRLPYWSMLASGDFDLMQPLFDMYTDALPLAKKRVETYYGHEGAYFPETMYFFGTWTNDNYGWNRNGKELGRADNGYLRWEWQSGIELLLMMVDYYKITQDQDFFDEKLLPMAESIIDLYDLRFPRDTDGEIRFNPAQALETYQEGTQNPTPEVAGLRKVLFELTQLSSSGVPASRLAQWERLLSEMPPIPLRSVGGGLAFKPAEVVGPKRNSEKPELYPVFPYSLYHVGLPDLDIADRTYAYRTDISNGGWQQDAIFAAMVGRAGTAQSNVISRFSTKHGGSRFPAIWGPNFDWMPDQTHGAVAMIALQKMLLIEEGQRILLFPSWPSNWDIDFKVHASGNTVIEGSLVGGELVALNVTPSERAADIENLLGATDTDKDGVFDQYDAYPNDPSESRDSDGDGVGDNQDVFPNDATETRDSDGDGIGDNADPVAFIPDYSASLNGNDYFVVEIDAENTTRADGTATAWSSTSSSNGDGLWRARTNAGFGYESIQGSSGRVFAVSQSDLSNAPALRLEVYGLDAADYEVVVLYTARNDGAGNSSNGAIQSKLNGEIGAAGTITYSTANASSPALSNGPGGNAIWSTYYGALGNTGLGAKGFTVDLAGAPGYGRSHAIAVAYRRISPIVVDTPPTITLNQPNASVGNASGSIEAVANDADGTISSVAFYYNGDQLINTITTPPYVVNWADVPDGTYTITAKATDNDGLETTSNAVQIIVNNSLNTPPTVTLNAPQGSAGNVSGSIEAVASDIDGSISRVQFYYNGGNLLRTVTQAPYVVNWASVPDGTYELTAVAYDDAGAQTTSNTVTVVVDSSLE